MSPSFLIKILCHTWRTFHHHTGIISNYLRWSLSGPEVNFVTECIYQIQILHFNQCQCDPIVAPRVLYCINRVVIAAQCTAIFLRSILLPEFRCQNVNIPIEFCSEAYLFLLDYFLGESSVHYIMLITLHETRFQIMLNNTLLIRILAVSWTKLLAF